MDINKIRTLFETEAHKSRGTTASDLELPAGTLKGADYTALSETGAEAYRTLTGRRFESKVAGIGHRRTALDVRAGGSVPREWHEVHQVEATMKKLIEDGESLTLTLKSGRTVNLEAEENITGFIKKGYLKLYKNPRDEDASQPDDNGRMIWSAAYYLVPNKSFQMVEEEIEKFSARGERITKAVTAALDELRNVTVSTRTNPRGDEKKDVEKLKKGTLAALPAIKEAFYAFEREVEKYRYDTQLPSYPDGEVWLGDITRAAIDQYGPRTGRYKNDVNLTSEKNLVRANELLLSRPYVLAVDDGNGGLTVTIDADRAFKAGKTFPEARAEAQKVLHDALVADEVGVRREYDSDRLYGAQLAILAKAFGSANVAVGQEGDHDFKDGVRGFQKVFEVKKEFLEKAKALVPQMRALQQPYGFDEKHYDIAIWEKTR